MTLMYQYGAQSVKCAVCNHVTGVGPGSNAATPPPAAMTPQQQQPPQQQPMMAAAGAPGVGPQAGHGPVAGPPQPQAQVQHVVIENPPTLDDKGHEVQSIAVGVTTKPGGQ